MRRWLVPALITLIVVAMTLACHGGALLRCEQYAYRDAAHYYYPLHQKVQREWSAGRWPLWDPSENAGMPLLGNPTAAVLYPGKLIFAAVPYPLGARLYVVAHALLAFVSMFALLRSWGTSGIGSSLSGLAYAFGAPVLFLYSNVIYLVGAAWAPLGMLAADRWVRLGDRRAIPGLAAVLAMEILGGDPETAYLTGFFASSYAVCRALNRRSRSPDDDAGRRGRRWIAPALFAILGATWVVAALLVASRAPALRPPTLANGLVSVFPWMSWVEPVVVFGWTSIGLVILRRWRRERQAGRRPYLGPTLAGLVTSAALAAMLSAAQLLPVLEFAAQSGRVLGEGTHEIFSFSLEPVRLIEFLWPNVSGTIFEGNHSWLDAANLGGSGKRSQVWVPSLYMGGLTLILALATSRLRGGPPWLVWMTAVGLLSLLASFGEYASPICVARYSSRMAAAIGGHDPPDVPVIRPDGRLRDGDGSVYWTLATILPGFKAFRFPSKFLTFTALALAALAGQGWDALIAGDPQIRRRSIAWSASLLGLTLVAFVAASIGGERHLSRLEGESRELGPLDAGAAYRDLRSGLVQGGLALGAVLGMATARMGRGRFSAALALVVTAADLAYANAGLVLTVPQRFFDTRPEVLAIIERRERASPASGPFRVHRMPLWEPPGWAKASSAERPREFIEWERRTLQAKYGIPLGVAYTLTIGAAELRDYHAFFRGSLGKLSPKKARSLGIPADRRVVIYPRRAFDLWNTRYFVLPYYPNKWADKNRGFASFLDRTEQVYPAPDTFQGEGGREKLRDWILTSDFQVRRNLAEYPRAWVVHRALESRANSTPEQVRLDPARVDEIVLSKDDLWYDPTRIVHDPRSVAWLETGRQAKLRHFLDGHPPTSAEAVRVETYESDRVELRAILDRPGLVVLSDVYYPGWTLTIDGRPAPIERANRMMRAAAVEQGEHTLVFTYRPASFRVGLAVTGLALAVLIAFGSRAARLGLAGTSERPIR